MFCVFMIILSTGRSFVCCTFPIFLFFGKINLKNTELIKILIVLNTDDVLKKPEFFENVYNFKNIEPCSSCPMHKD